MPINKARSLDSKFNHRSTNIHKFSPIALAVASTCALLAVDASAQQETKSAVLEEITVTATRRAETILDIPYNISALTASSLKDAGATSLADIARILPGMSMVETGGRSVNNDVYLRGANSDPAGFITSIPNVGVAATAMYLNDSPLFIGNPKLTDLQRVEVLRGPQGTLYGSGSVGGTIRFIYNQPKMDTRSYSVNTSIAQSNDSDDLNYSVDGVVNVPISDTVALRASGGYDVEAGFVDANSIAVTDSSGVPALADPSDPFGSGMVLKDVEDADESDAWHLRVSLLWEPSDKVNILATFFHQEDDIGDITGQTPDSGLTSFVTGLPLFVPGAPEREHSRFVQEPLDREIDLATLEVNVDLGFATLTSSSSYYDESTDSIFDFTTNTEVLSGLVGLYPGLNRLSTPLFRETSNEGFVQEFRLVSQSDGPWQWVGGLYYSDTESTLIDDSRIVALPDWSMLPNSNLPGGISFADSLLAQGVLPASIQLGQNFFQDRLNEIEELAAFGELSYNITDAWQVTVGARFFSVDTDQELSIENPLCGPSCSADLINPKGFTQAIVGQDDQDHILKFNTSYDLNNDTMLYFTYSEGFRRGGANALPTTGPLSQPENASLLSFDPDTVENFEVGIKGTLADRYRYGLTLYRMDFDDLQVFTGTVVGGLPFNINANSARSQGAEFELAAQLTKTIDASFSYSYIDAELTKDFAIQFTNGADGTRLPGISKNSASVNVNYRTPLEGGAELLANINGSYRSGFNTAFNETNFGYSEQDGFDVWNASVSWITDNWRFTGFIDNITDEIAISGAQQLFVWAAHSQLELIGKPRTIGLQVSYTYE